MKPVYHANASVKRHGGKVEDYLPIHNFFDSSKQCMPDVRHRAILHSSFGIFLLERVFGEYIINSDGTKVCVRDLGEEHVIEDMGTIPTVEKWLKNLPLEDWMFSASKQKVKKITSFKFDNID